MTNTPGASFEENVQSVADSTRTTRRPPTISSRTLSAWSACALPLKLLTLSYIQRRENPALTDETAASTIPRGFGSGLYSILQVRELPALLFLFLIAAGLRATAPNFGSSANLLAIAQDMAIVGIMGVGMTMVILTAGIDLSVASILAVSAAVMAKLMVGGTNIWLSVLAALTVGTACGMGNGILIAWLRIPPIIATLGTMGILRASVTLYTGAKWIGPLPQGFQFVGTGWSPVALLAVVTILFTVFLSQLRVGRYVHAVGGNEEAVRLSGIRVNRVKFVVYTLNGLLAAVSALILASSMSSAQSNMAMGYELSVIAAVVIGGTSITGGKGSVPGTVAGAAIMSVFYSALILLGVSKYWHKLIIGGVILAAVMFDKLRYFRER